MSELQTGRIRQSSRRAGVILSALALGAVPLLSGCYSGFAATTNVQSTMNSGDGTQTSVGEIKIENATLVTGPEGSGTATLITTLINTGNQPDRLVSVLINGAPAYVTPGTETLAPGQVTNFGYDGASWINSYAIEIPSSSYVPVVMQFEVAGVTSFTALSVPPAGIYEGIAPNPATALAP